MNKTMRRIRSFVLREGRLTQGQQNAINNHWVKYGLDFTRSKLDLDSIFNRNAPKILDIGPGMGDSTITMASACPENDYLAVEVHRPGVGSLLRQIDEYGLTNIRIINHDVIDTLEYQLPNNSLDCVYIYFPDPWPKKKHHKRRLINIHFLNILKYRLKTNARIFLATDWEDYAEQIIDVFETTPGFINLSGKGQYAPRPHWRPVTKFEHRGKKLSHAVWDMVFAYKQID